MSSPSPAREITLTLPKPHSGQQPIWTSRARFRVAANGRRFGKTTLDTIFLAETMLDGQPAAYYAPSYPQLAFVWRDIKSLLATVIKDKSETQHRIELLTGGSLDMWSLESDRPGVGRKYKRVVIDEAGMCPNLEEAWTEAIRPTLTDLRGDAVFNGTPKGRNYFWRLFCLGLDAEYPDWASWQLPTVANPYIDPSEVEAARQLLPERAFRQEYLADFIEESGGVFRCVRDAVDAGRTANEEPKAGRWYCGGVDLAKYNDFSVINIYDDLGRQVYFERFNQISWELQIDRIVSAALKYDALLNVDTTGIGDPLFEQLAKRGCKVNRYTMTAGSKSNLIDNLAILLEHKRLRLMDITEQTNELLSYEYQVTGQTLRTNAPQGMHDDCVISKALAVNTLRVESHPEIEAIPPEQGRTREYVRWAEEQARPEEDYSEEYY